MSSYDLVTLDEVKAALRIDTVGDSPDSDRIWLEILITGASRAVMNYLKDGVDTFVDTAGYPIPAEVPENVKIATIALIGHVYREPDGDEQKAFSQGNLPWVVTALLYPLRDPALA